MTAATSSKLLATQRQTAYINALLAKSGHRGKYVNGAYADVAPECERGVLVRDWLRSLTRDRATEVICTLKYQTSHRRRSR